jgi:hypothetical protein
MKRILVSLIVLAALALTLTGRVAATTGTGAARADVLRTVYFSAVDAKGTAVTDLTAADLTVKEGGKDRAIAGVQPATAPMQVSLLVDDAGTGAFQAAVAQFIDATLGHAQYAISVMNPQPMKVANYTADVDELKTAIGRMGQRGRISIDNEQIIEAVGGAAKELQQRKAARPVIVVLTVSGEKALSDLADSALNNLKSSGASLSVLYITGIELGKVLGDGPKQSGGMIQQASSGVALGPVLAKMADNLMHQYVLTYTIPDGVKLNEKLSLATSRKGVTLLAPSRLPDK